MLTALWDPKAHKKNIDRGRKSQRTCTIVVSNRGGRRGKELREADREGDLAYQKGEEEDREGRRRRGRNSLRP